MEIRVKRAVCTVCGCEIGDNEIAIERDGELLCLGCIKKEFGIKDGAVSDLLEWLLGDNLTYGRHFRRKYIDEERIVVPRGREIA